LNSAKCRNSSCRRRRRRLTHCWFELSLAGEYRVTAAEIFGGYILAVVIGIGIALLFSLVSLARADRHAAVGQPQHDPESRARPLIIVWFKYGVGPNIMMAFAICFFPIVLTTARGLKEVEPDLLDLCARSRLALAGICQDSAPNALPYIFAGMKVAAILGGRRRDRRRVPRLGPRARLSHAAGAGDARHRGDVHGGDPHHAAWRRALSDGARPRAPARRADARLG